MHEFIAKHQDKIASTLSGFDRLVVRGHLRSIGTPQGMMNYLWTNHVFLKDFGGHVEKVTQRLKEASLAEAKACRRPVQYLNSSQIVGNAAQEFARRVEFHERMFAPMKQVDVSLRIYGYAGRLDEMLFRRQVEKSGIIV